MAEENVIRLKEFESIAIKPLALYEPGVYIQPLHITGNSLISKLFVLALDPGASVEVIYQDYGSGGDYGERHTLPSHSPVTAPSVEPSQQLVTNFNDKPIMTAIVSGGRATFGVYVTVTTAASTDIDNALQREGDLVALVTDKGLPYMVYDEKAGVYRFARGEGGIQDVRVTGNVAVGEPGTAYFQDFAGSSTPGLEQVLLTAVVPSGFRLNLLSVLFVSRFEAAFFIEGDGLIIGSGRTGAAVPQVNFAYRIARTFESGKIVEVKATVRASAPIDGVECYLQGTLSPV